MKRLRHLQLWKLDKQQKINCKTPLLSKLGVARGTPFARARVSIKNKRFRSRIECHENLEILHIKSCHNLKSIFEPSSQGDHGVVFDKIRELELSGLPQMRKIVREALRLRILRLSDCPSLTSVIDGTDGVCDLEMLEVKTYEKNCRRRCNFPLAQILFLSMEKTIVLVLLTCDKWGLAFC